MKGSNRGTEMVASPIRRLLPYARQAKADGVGVYHLNIGQPDIKTPLKAIECLKELDDQIISYGPSEGLTELRGKVSNYYDKFQADIKAENIYVTTGASEAILFALLATCDKGDEVIVPEPFYANYLGFTLMADVKIIPLTTTIEEQFALSDTVLFESLITERTKAIILCNPGNPTGHLYTKSELESIQKLVIKHDLFLIVDEVYKEFCYDQEFCSVLSFDKLGKHAIVIDSISKVFSACGARVGYLISKNMEVLDSVNKYAQLRLCPPYHGQQLAIACYENIEHYLLPVLEEYKRRRDILYTRLSAIEGVVAYKPLAAFYNIIELPIDDADKFCKWLLTDFRYNNKTIMLAPASGFYSNTELGKRQVRIAYILNENDLHKSMDCLEMALKQYNRN